MEFETKLTGRIVRSSQSPSHATVTVRIPDPRQIILRKRSTDGCERRVNEEVLVRLKWGETEYRGTLVSVDSYMNIQLNNTEEFVDGKSTGSLGQVMIR